jgi:hypothetical protein
MRVIASDSPTVAHELLPPNAVSIADGVAAVTLSPFARDLTEAERTAILAADRQRIFVCACGDAELSRPGVPVKFSDYPANTMNWCIEHASLICLGALERGNTSEKHVESLLSQFDTDEVAEHRFVIRVIVDASFDIAECPWLQKPHEPPPIIRSIK